MRRYSLPLLAPSRHIGNEHTVCNYNPSFEVTIFLFPHPNFVCQFTSDIQIKGFAKSNSMAGIVVLLCALVANSHRMEPIAVGPLVQQPLWQVSSSDLHD